jgi:hypothetical protein
MPQNNRYFGIQTDWNQTLLTLFNELGVGMDSPKIIRVPNKFKELIETLCYYDSINYMIGNRFNVEFVDSEEDIMYVCGKPLEIIKKINDYIVLTPLGDEITIEEYMKTDHFKTIFNRILNLL